MWRYTIKRLLWLVIIFFCVAVLIFTVMYFVPGDPARIIMGETATEQELFDCRERLGLNDPYHIQLGRYLYDTFIRFDFGTSYMTHLPVSNEFVSRLPRTFLLGLITMLVSVGFGIPLGIYSAIHRNGIMDHPLRVVSMIGVSIPNFWLAMLLVQLFSVKLKWLPPLGIGGIEYWILPVISGALGGIGSNARMTRSAVLETVRADYITTARAKGQTEGIIIGRHMLPNAMIPIVSALGGQFSSLIGGSVVIEMVFSFPGIGTYMMTAVSNRDYPVIRSCVLILALFAAVMVLVTDLAYAYLDPRIKAQYILKKAKKEEAA